MWETPLLAFLTPQVWCKFGAWAFIRGAYIENANLFSICIELPKECDSQSALYWVAKILPPSSFNFCCDVWEFSCMKLEKGPPRWVGSVVSGTWEALGASCTFLSLDLGAMNEVVNVNELQHQT
ncbi:hypothetical protein PIB30_092179 [Stylosanthes scabra]|uniref:Uncharacterized protein n=1 Tax=Stylosanthes scabra TaxID=79078 RepID=A0ABU6YVH7_9FABA|nr:hypothetical protein [Stylosanthes scabra]